MSTGSNEKPKAMTFNTFPKSVTVQEKESVEIECEIVGNPKTGKTHRTRLYIISQWPKWTRNDGGGQNNLFTNR